MGIELNVSNESDRLEVVVLGIGDDRGEPRGINPMMRWHLENNTFPGDEVVKGEIKHLRRVFEAAGVEVLRPTNLSGVEQIFTRDIGFVIDSKFVVANMRKKERQTEIKAIDHVVSEIADKQILSVPEGMYIEGGDVMLWNEHIFIGIGARTTKEAVDFIAEQFPHKKVHGLELVVDEDDRNANILHLDCAFQPIGTKEAIFHREGFVNPPEVILDLFKEEDLINVTQEEKNAMFPNIFSLGPKKVIIEKGFERLRTELHKRGFEIYQVPYSEVAKLGGLLRCSTMPLRRAK